MENKTKTLQDFEQFATDTLNNHVAELNTRYENEAIDNQTVEEAYMEHKEIFSQELEEKIKELSSGQNDQWLHTELQNQKHSFLSKLNINQSKN
ncbi:MAG: hypothetical protein ABI683_07865 [Ginsengibacter sp.]